MHSNLIIVWIDVKILWIIVNHYICLIFFLQCSILCLTLFIINSLFRDVQCDRKDLFEWRRLIIHLLQDMFFFVIQSRFKMSEFSLNSNTFPFTLIFTLVCNLFYISLYCRIWIFINFSIYPISIIKQVFYSSFWYTFSVNDVS